jgi:hypothetical protein
MIETPGRILDRNRRLNPQAAALQSAANQSVPFADRLAAQSQSKNRHHVYIGVYLYSMALEGGQNVYRGFVSTPKDHWTVGGIELNPNAVAFGDPSLAWTHIYRRRPGSADSGHTP